MPIGGIIGGIGSAIGGLFGGSAASDAAAAQAKAAQQATQLQGEEFLAIQQALLPFLKLGTTGANVLDNNFFGISPEGGFNPNAPFLQPISSVIGQPPNPNDPNLRNAFAASPGYQYQLDQMNNATQNSAAARTGAVSGNMLRQLQTNAQGLASGDWWNNGQQYQDQGDLRNQIINALTNIGGSGQNAAAQLGGFGQSAASSIGNNLNLAGSARAAGILGSSNALSNGFSGAANSLGSLFSGGNNPLSFLFGNNSGQDFGGGSDAGITNPYAGLGFVGSGG